MQVTVTVFSTLYCQLWESFTTLCDEGQNQAESFLTCHQNMPIKKVQMIPKNSVWVVTCKSPTYYCGLSDWVWDLVFSAQFSSLFSSSPLALKSKLLLRRPSLFPSNSPSERLEITQVWSPTQFYSVGFLQSSISVESGAFYKHIIRGLCHLFLTVSWDLHA